MNGSYNSGTNNLPTLNEEIIRDMQVYFNAKENSRFLTEDNRILVSSTEYYISSVPNNHPVKQLINNEINNYYLKAKELGQEENRNNADELRQSSRSRALVKKEEMPIVSKRAAFINIAILIYGSLNIGFILALALLK